MSKPVCALTAAAVSLLVLGDAQAQPRPRFPTRLPVQTAPAPPQPATPPPSVAAPAVQTAPAPEPETPRAAPLGAVQAAELPSLPPVAPAQPALEAGPAAAQAAPVGPAAPVPDGERLTHVVGAGDTLYGIARRYGVGPQALAEANGLSFATTLRPGQRITLPAGAVDGGPEAALPGRRAPSAATAAAPVSPPSLPTPAAPIPSPPSEPPQAPAPTASPAETAVVSPPAPTPLVPQSPPPSPPPAASTPVIPAPVATAPARPAPARSAPVRPAPASPSPAVAAAPTPVAPVSPVFAWPVAGPILAPFGPTGVGQRNDGLRISAAEGTSVRAAAPGRVVYAGDQVKGGYGKLVLVEHEGRWFTAYAHLNDIRVRMQDRVTAGQELGSVGRTGSVAAPQLYFEVRHAPTATDRARPVDPLPLLPAQ